MRILPALGRMVPAMRLRSVVLPEPLGPISPRISPGDTASDMALTATNPPNALVKLATSSSAVMASAFLRHAGHDLGPSVLDRAGDAARQDDRPRQPGPSIEQRPGQSARQFERPAERCPAILDEA